MRMGRRISLTPNVGAQTFSYSAHQGRACLWCLEGVALFYTWCYNQGRLDHRGAAVRTACLLLARNHSSCIKLVHLFPGSCIFLGHGIYSHLWCSHTTVAVRSEIPCSTLTGSCSVAVDTGTLYFWWHLCKADTWNHPLSLQVPSLAERFSLSKIKQCDRDIHI